MDNHHYRAAVRAAGAALCWHNYAPGVDTCGQCSDEARAVIDAARPHIEQDVGERIAAAIEAVADGVTGSPSYRHVYIDALGRSAAIARAVAQPHDDTRPANNPGTVVHPGTADKRDPNPRT